MSNQWFRLYSEFANDPKVQMMSEALQRRLLMLFCFRCNGDVTLRNDEVAFQLRISPELWEQTKAEFIERGFIDESNNVLNWDKRQYRSDSSAERVRRHRDSKKQPDVTLCNVTVTPPEQIQNRTDTEQNREFSHDLKIVSSKPKQAKSQGTRLSSDWELPQEWGDWAETKGLNSDAIIHQAQKFRNYWVAKAGANGTKRDWEATWQNWIFTSLEGFKK